VIVQKLAAVVGMQLQERKNEAFFDFLEARHHRTLTPPENRDPFAAIKQLTPSELSPLVNLMLSLRSLPARLGGESSMELKGDKPMLDVMYAGGFVPLEESSDEIVFGMVGQFWKLKPDVEPTIQNPQELLMYSDPNFAKVATNLKVTPDAAGSVICSTETRIHVPDIGTRKKFAFYWRLISMGSGWIRILWLNAIKHRAERAGEK
jgi:hypothetical protein